MKMDKWERKPLGAVADLCLGKMLDQNKNRGEPLPYLANVNVRWGEFALDDLRTMRFELKEMDRYGLRFGDIVMCEGGEPGRCAIWKNKVPGMMIQKALHRIRPKEFLDYRFLFYSFLHIGQFKGFDQYVTGATIKHLPSEKLAKIEIEVPPLPIQQNIACILSAYDELIENNQRRSRILEDMVRSIYREWFVHFRYPGHESVLLVDSPLGQIPQGWKVKKLGDVAATFRGRSYRSVDLADEGGVPFLNLKCIDRDGGFRRSGLKRYVGEFKEAHLARKGDIVMGVTDMTQERRIVARAALVPSLDFEFGVFSMDLVRVEPIGEMPKSFLYSFFRYSSFADEVKQHANGANVLHLSPERITDFRFSLPPVDLMERFVRFVAPTLERMDVLQNQTANLRCTRDLLLPRLLSGQVALNVIESELDEVMP
ncbi:MAG: restriction endonuclease subunit S [Sideroxydans sp.]